MEKMPQQEDHSSKLKHLEKGIPHIIVCLEDYANPREAKSLKHVQALKNGSQNIKYLSNKEYYREHNISSDPEGTYAISEVSSENKFSENFLNCTGLVIVGIDKETGDNISIVTHQQSDTTISSEAFKKHLTEALQKMKQVARKGSIDAVIVGGNDDNDNLEEYKESIKAVTAIAELILGFEPRLATGPKLTANNEPTNIYFDTEHRRLYLFMPTQEHKKV